MNDNLISVIIPIYKKEKTIKEDLERINNVLKETPYKYEMVAVVDGTEVDKSYEKAKKVNISNLKLYGYKENRGKGIAVRYGMLKAKGDIIIFIDAGGDVNPEGLVMLLEHMRWYRADIIIASKLHSASKVIPYPLKRKILTYGYYFFVKLLFGLKTRDTQTGLKAYKREVLEKVLPRLTIKRFAFDIEILVCAKRLGFNKIYDCPVEVNWGNDISSISLFGKGGIWPFVKDTLAVFYRLWVLKFYDNGVLRAFVYDKELKMKILTGKIDKDGVRELLSKLFLGKSAKL